MQSKIQDIARRVDLKRRETSMTQTKLAACLNVDQGHLSKVLAGKEPVSTKMRLRMASLLNSWPTPRSGDLALEAELISELRKSPIFREFIRAALKMHKS